MPKTRESLYPFIPSSLGRWICHIFITPSQRGIVMIQNKILAEIIVALGGTVTDPNNRNQLLKDWLAAT